MSYITDSDLFDRLLDEAKSSKPACTADSPSASLRIIDWSEFLFAGFWPYVLHLCKLSGDTDLYFLDVEKTNDDSFYRASGRYPAISLSTQMSEDQYVAALNEFPGGSLNRAFAPAYTDAYVLIPASGAWRISGDSDTERGKIISAVGLPPDELFPHDFLSDPDHS